MNILNTNTRSAPIQTDVPLSRLPQGPTTSSSSSSAASPANGLSSMAKQSPPNPRESFQEHRRRRSSLQSDTSGGQGQSTVDTRFGRKYRPGKDPALVEDAELENEVDRFSDNSSSSVDWSDVPSEDGLVDDEETGLTGKERRKRRRRKVHRTRLDERVAPAPAVKPTASERRLADFNVLKKSAANAVLIGLWYLFSLSISIYNKWMFSSDHLDFHFPLFTTCLHMLVQFSLASLVLWMIPSLRPRHNTISLHDAQSGLRSPPQEAQSQKPLMTRMFYLTRIGPCGTATGLDIGLGNMSLKFISLTFFTMCKSSALAFVLLFAFVFRLETPSWKLIFIIATMTVGVIMMVAGETAFNLLGFFLIISSAFFSGFRWALTQILLLRNPATSNPFSSIFFLAPIMFLSLLVIALPVEGPVALMAGLQDLIEKKGLFLGIGILLFPGCLAFLMTSSEFALLARTSVVTLSICGIFKEVVTISAAGIVFHDPLTPINVSGLIVTIGSIAAYNYIKINKMRKQAQRDVQGINEVNGAAGGAYTAVDDVDELPESEGSGLRGEGEPQHVRKGSLLPNLSTASRGIMDGAISASPVKRAQDIE